MDWLLEAAAGKSLTNPIEGSRDGVKPKRGVAIVCPLLV
jgi:hypothetical protein